MGGRGVISKKVVATPKDISLSLGEQYLKDNNIKEVSYNKAIQSGIEELSLQGINTRDDLYDAIDSGQLESLYPSNAELFDEFVFNGSFDAEEYASFLMKRKENMEIFG